MAVDLSDPNFIISGLWSGEEVALAVTGSSWTSANGLTKTEAEFSPLVLELDPAELLINGWLSLYLDED